MRKLFVLIMLIYAYTLFSQCKKAESLIFINDEDALSYKVELGDEYKMFITLHYKEDKSFYSIYVFNSDNVHQSFALVDDFKEVTNTKMNPAIFYPFTKVGLAALANDIAELKLIRIKDKNENTVEIILMDDEWIEDIHCIVLELVDKFFN
jgi:hypothetical protein